MAHAARAAKARSGFRLQRSNWESPAKEMAEQC